MTNASAALDNAAAARLNTRRAAATPHAHNATSALGWIVVSAIIVALIPAAISAERFTPDITPTHLPSVNGMAANAMLLTRTSMPPGLTATSSAYVAPTAEQLADEHAAWAWIGPTARPGSVPLAFIVSRVAEIAVANQAWPQVSSPAFFALRHFNGSVQIYEATGAQSLDGVAEYSAPYWLSGVYSEITAGEAHMCFLKTDQHVECMTTTASFPAPAALMGSRSAEIYTQISAASRFTCGLRVDQFVECYGRLGRDENALGTISFQSNLRYVSIAAQLDSGYCGVVVTTGEVACYSVHATVLPEEVVLPAPTLPLSFRFPLWLQVDASLFPFGQACAMRSDGVPECLIPLLVGASVPRPMSQVTMVDSIVQGATSDNGQLQRADPVNGWSSSDPVVNLFEVLRFIAVDPRVGQGNDATCAAVSMQSPVEMAGLVPCASLSHALTLVAHPHTWIQLLPSVYSVGSLTLNFSETTIASVPPSSLTPDEIALLGSGTALSWAVRMAEAGSSQPVIDCTGSLHCFTTMHSNMQFVGLTFTGSLSHAVVSFSDSNPQFTNFLLPPSTLTIINCIFDAMGAVLRKQQGSVTITDCTISNSLQWANTTNGLIELEDASLVMSGTTFTHNHMPVADTFLRSCLRSVSTTSVTVTVGDSHWLDNSATSKEWEVPRIPGGVAMQVLANGPLVLSVTDSSFAEQSVRCQVCSGGAVSVTTGVGASGDVIQTSFERCTFDSNINIIADVDPTSDEAYSQGSSQGACLSIVEAELANPTALLTAAEVRIESCHFRNSQATQGGCLFLGVLSGLALSDSTFEHCTATSGGAAQVWSSSTSFGFVQSAYALTGVSISNCHARTFAGGLLVNGAKTSVAIERLTVNDVSSGSDGGVLYISGSGEVEVSNSSFTNTTAAEYAGVIAVDSTPSLQVTRTNFSSVFAGSRGGAIGSSNCELRVVLCNFVDVGLRYQPEREIDPTRVIDRLGGVIAATAGSVMIFGGTITRVSALPNDLQLSSCLQNYDAAAGLASIGLGGVVSGEYAQLYLYDVSVSEVQACSGGLVYSRSSLTLVNGGSFSNISAHSGGLLALVAVLLIEIVNIASTHAISAVAAGGALVLNECPQIKLQANVISDVTVTNGDGGLIWLYALRRPAFEFKDNILSGVTAPNGAGAIIFVQSAPNAFLPLDPIDDPSLSNTFNNQSDVGPSSLYGPLIATGVATLSALHPTLSAPAGSLLSTSLSPLQITALDSFEQTITQDRELIVQVSCPDVEFRGTTLRRIEAADGSALFSDLRVVAEPGDYSLSFSIVTLPLVKVAVDLTVTADCPAASFYSSSDRSCVECASDILVYNATANACQRCPAGWQRVASNDTSGALRDGVSCAICPLGQVSAAGGLCAACGPNTYQPTPLGECVQCSSVDGLSCVGDGLAQVQSGFFAIAVGTGREQRIRTYQCPETFCSAAQVQVAEAAGNSSSAAVNAYDQCAFPRLASPTNLLCGECAEGYRPWGNKCAQCDSVDGGLMFLLVVLSLLLCFWLIRSSLGPPSAGHAVVVLFFVQTAMLELGSLNSLLAWLNVVLMSPNSVGRCIAPLTPYEQVQAQILMPVALWIELMVFATIHFLTFKRWGTSPAQQSAGDAAAVVTNQQPSVVMRFISQFSVDMYVSATFSLLLFTYTQVAIACLSYLRCVEVGDESVVFSQPAMRCGSDEYAKTKVLVVIALIVYVAGFPVGIMSFLWRRSAMVREAHALVSQRLHGVRSFSPAVASGEINTGADEGFVPAVPSASKGANDSLAEVDRFLRRYAPLFAMYSSSAWFWQVFVLARRVVFVTVSVMLLATPRRRFLAFTLSTLCSLLLQLVFRPFRLDMFNRAEFASHALLIVLSSTLISETSPYSDGVDAFIFLLVIPPLGLYILYAIVAAVRRSNQDRAQAAATGSKATIKHAVVVAGASSFSAEAANGSMKDDAVASAGSDDVVPVRLHVSPLAHEVEMAERPAPEQLRSPSVVTSHQEL